MARPKKDPNQIDTRIRILQAARLEFAAHGLGATLEVIATRCGIRRPSLLHHFPSKDLLLEALLEDIIHTTSQEMLAVLRATTHSSEARLRAMFQILREIEKREQGVAGALLNYLLSAEARSGVMERFSQFISLIEQTVIDISPELSEQRSAIRAVLTHLLTGEMTRIALGKDSAHIWGDADSLELLYTAFFTPTKHNQAGQ